MSNQVVTRKKPKWSVAITQQDYQNLIRNTLNDPARANRFQSNPVAFGESLIDFGNIGLFYVE